MKNRMAALITGLLLVFTALVSGGTYPWSKDAFTFVTLAAFLLSMTGRDRPGMTGLWPVWALLGVTYLSSMWTVNLNGTLGQAFPLTGYALFACLAAYSAGEEDGKRTLLKFAFAASVIVSVYAVYQYFVGFRHTEQYLMETGTASGLSEEEVARAIYKLRHGRAFSTMFSPNVLACYLAMVFPIGLALMAESAKKWRWAVYVLGLAAVFAACLLTKSVGGVLSLAAGMFIYILFKKAAGRARTSRWTIAALVAAVVVAGMAGLFVLKERTGGYYGFERSVSERMNYWAGAAGTLTERPITGYGAGSFRVVYPAHAHGGLSETHYAHNLLLQTMAETGMPGLAAVLLVFGFFFTRCYKVSKTEDGAFMPAVAAGGAAFFVHNLTDFSYYIPESAVLFWALFGLAAAGDSRQPVKGKRDIAVRAAILAAALVFGFFYVKAYLAGQRQADAMALLRERGITSRELARSRPAPEAAVRLVEEAVSLKPYDDSLHAFLAGLYETRSAVAGRRYAEKAGAEYRMAIGLNPYYPYYYRDLGIFYLKSGDKVKARDEFLEAIRRYPANPDLKKYPPLTEN